MNRVGWRKWHRWVGLAAAPFLLFAAGTGVVAGVAEMTGEDEEARELARERVSPVRLPAAPGVVNDPVAKALAAAATRADGGAVDKVLVDFKAEPPTATVFVGNPTGGEDRKIVCDARTGHILREEAYADKPFLTRLHSGEAFGDWGLVAGTLWGLALAALVVTGLVIYFAMRKPGRKGLGRLFW